MSELIFKHNDSRFEFRVNPWDTRAFGWSCHELSIALGNDAAEPQAVRDFIVAQGMRTLTVRVPPEDSGLRRYLHSLGFMQVELQLNCRLHLQDPPAPKRRLGTLRLAEETDLQRVQEIASHIFLNSRFRNITGITPDRIGRRFANWVTQLQRESPDYAYVLEVDERIVGFFYSQPTSNERELYAALGGIAHDCRGPFGFYLYPAVMAAYYQSGIRSVVSAIAADNMGALNLWAGLGTRFPQAIDIFMWNPE